MADHRVCEKCWGAVEADAGACPLCGSDALVAPGSIPTPAFSTETTEPGMLTTSEPATAGRPVPKALIAFLVLVALMTAGWGLKSIVLGPGYALDDFTGQWVMRDKAEYADLSAGEPPAEIRFSMWRNGDMLEHNIPVGGNIRFDKRTEGNNLKGTTLIGIDDPDPRPVVATLSRDRKTLTLYFKFNQTSLRPDVILHATRE